MKAVRGIMAGIRLVIGLSLFPLLLLSVSCSSSLRVLKAMEEEAKLTEKEATDTAVSVVRAGGDQIRKEIRDRKDETTRRVRKEIERGMQKLWARHATAVKVFNDDEEAVSAAFLSLTEAETHIPDPGTFKRVTKEEIRRYAERNPKILSCQPQVQEVVAAIHRKVPVRAFSCTRSAEEQEEHLSAGRSKAKRSYHLYNPSWAVDIVPYKGYGPIDWQDYPAMNRMIAEAIVYLSHLVDDNGCWNGRLFRSGLMWLTPKDPYHFEFRKCL